MTGVVLSTIPVPLTLNANSASAPAAALAGTVSQVVGANGQNAITEWDSFGTGFPAIVARAAAGTGALPSGPLSAAVLFSMSGRPYGTTGYSGTTRFAINFLATENQDDTHFGNQMQVRLTSTGTTTVAAMTLLTTGVAFSGGLTISANTLITTNTTFTNGAAAAAGTLLNAPVAGNPTKWIPISDNGTTRYIPAW